MKKISLVLVLAAATVGCAADKMAADDGGGDDGGGGDPQPPPPPPQPLDASGSYRIHSTFDIAANMPGTVGTAVNGFIAATDDPNDPMLWVVDQIVQSMPDGFFKDLLVSAEPFVAGQLNAQLLSLAPDLTSTLLTVGHDLADISKHFGLSEQLDVSMIDGQYLGTMTADGFELTIANQPHSFPFTSYQLENVVAPGVSVHIDATNGFSIGRHELPIAYGKVLRIALDAAIIPAIDGNASNLGELLNDLVDCNAVGQQMADAIGFGGQALWAGACVTGLDFAADQLYAQIAGIDTSMLDFLLDGKATATDVDHDSKVDHLNTGVWTGMLTYSGVDSTLGPSTFLGVRQ